MVAALALLPLAAQAQSVNKGAASVAGTVGFSVISGGGSSLALIDISPTAGFYIADDFALGLGLGFNTIIGEGESITVATLTPFARWYFATPPLFLEANAGLAFVEDITTGSFGVNFGYSWFANQNVAFEPQLFFQATTESTTTFGIAMGITAFLGRNR
jgi:hypothetical protein